MCSDINVKFDIDEWSSKIDLQGLARGVQKILLWLEGISVLLNIFNILQSCDWNSDMTVSQPGIHKLCLRDFQVDYA